MSSQSNIWKYLLVGAGALVSAAVIYHLISKGTNSNRQCLKEIDELGPPKKDPNGMLNFNYYKDIFMIISKHAKAKFANEKKKLLEQRRQCLREGKMVEYREIVRDMVSKEEKTFEDLL